ncbi:MAG: YqjK family protein [Burkholderiales bacterium]
MSPPARELAHRREALIAQCEAQRRQIAEVAQPLKSASHIADRALGIARYLRAHPLLVGVAFAAAMIASRGRLLRWVGTALPIVGAGLRAGRALRKLRSHIARDLDVAQR